MFITSWIIRQSSHKCSRSIKKVSRGSSISQGRQLADHKSSNPQKAALLISIISHLIRSITWWLSKLVMVLRYGHGSLLQSSKFLLLYLYESFRYVIGSKILSKLLPSDRRSIGGTSIVKWLPPVLSFSLELSWSVQHLLLIIALRYVELLFHYMKPIICFQ